MGGVAGIIKLLRADERAPLPLLSLAAAATPPVGAEGMELRRASPLIQGCASSSAMVGRAAAFLHSARLMKSLALGERKLGMT